MFCYVCATKNGEAKVSVALCQTCGVALCVTHVADKAANPQGGMAYSCNHHLPTTEEVERASASTDKARMPLVA